MSFFDRNVLASFTALNEGRPAPIVRGGRVEARAGHQPTQAQQDAAEARALALPARRNTYTVRCRREGAGQGSTLHSPVQSHAASADVVHRFVDVRELPGSWTHEVVSRMKNACAALTECAVDAPSATSLLSTYEILAGGRDAGGSSTSTEALAKHPLVTTFVANFEVPRLYVCQCDSNFSASSESLNGPLDPHQAYSPRGNCLVRLTTPYRALGNAAVFMQDVFELFDVPLVVRADPLKAARSAAAAASSAAADATNSKTGTAAQSPTGPRVSISLSATVPKPRPGAPAAVTPASRRIARLEQFVAVLVAKVAAALRLAHEQGVTHGAVSASNVFVTRHIMTTTIGGDREAFDEAHPGHAEGATATAAAMSGGDVWPIDVSLHDAAAHRWFSCDDKEAMWPDMTAFSLCAAPHPRVGKDLQDMGQAHPFEADFGRHIAQEQAAAAAKAVTDILPAAGLSFFDDPVGPQGGGANGQGSADMTVPGTAPSAAANETVVSILGVPPPPVEALYLEPNCLTAFRFANEPRQDVWALGQLVVELLTGLPEPPFAGPSGVALLPRPGASWSIHARNFVSVACSTKTDVTCETLLDHPFIKRNLATFAKAFTTTAGGLAPPSSPGDLNSPTQVRLSVGTSAGQSSFAFGNATVSAPRGLLSSCLRSNIVGVQFEHRTVLQRLQEREAAALMKDALVAPDREGVTHLHHHHQQHSIFMASTAAPGANAAETGGGERRRPRFADPQPLSVTDSQLPAFAAGDGPGATRTDDEGSGVTAATACLVPALYAIADGADPCASRLSVPRSTDGTSRVALVGREVDARGHAAITELCDALAMADAALPGYSDQLLLSLLYAAANGLLPPADTHPSAAGSPRKIMRPSVGATPAADPHLPKSPAHITAGRAQGAVAERAVATEPLSKAVVEHLAVTAATLLPPASNGAAPPTLLTGDELKRETPVSDAAAILKGISSGRARNDAMTAAAAASSEGAAVAACSSMDLANFLYAKWFTTSTSHDAEAVLRLVEARSGFGAATVYSGADAAAGGALGSGVFSPSRPLATAGSNYASFHHARAGSYRVDPTAPRTPSGRQSPLGRPSGAPAVDR
jgi:hypothetical protein